jgi:hypothetical protein
MKKIILTSLVIGIFLFSSVCFGQSTEPGDGSESKWQTEFETALKDGQFQLKRKNSGGLGYTPTEQELFMDEEKILSTAIKKALKKEAPPCECMKIAIDFDYNPYSVIKNIYASAKDLDLDQLCMCATEKGVGVSSQVVKKAATDAGRPLDEITQSQCLNEDVGLAFTLEQEDSTEDMDPPDRPIDPLSPSVP